MQYGKSWLAAMLCAAALSGCGGSDPAVGSTSDDGASALEVQSPAATDATVATEDTATASEVVQIASEATVGEVDEETDTASPLAMVASNASNAVGYGHSVTGGYGHNVRPQRVSTPDGLAKALCGNIKGGRCLDDAPAIIEVATTIDFTGTEGSLHAQACNYSSCSWPYKKERLAVFGADKHCEERKEKTFDIAYDKAGSESLLVGSNKTLIGVGSHGVIRGKGLMLASGVSNVIIRNLTFKDINPGIIFVGDAIRLGNTDRVWIDHNRFKNIGRQMLATGWQGGAASNVTVSWNEFDGRTEFPEKCDGKHYWNMLLMGNGDTITFASNWIHDFSGRGPDIHGQNQVVHFTNNYFQDGSWYAIDPGTSRVLMEANYFKNVKKPLLKKGNVYAPLTATAECQSTLKRNCERNIADASETLNLTMNAAALNAFKGVPAGAIAAPYGVSKVPARVSGQAGPGHLGSGS